MIIRHTTSADLVEVTAIHREAFGQEEEAELVKGLLRDKTAMPLVSLLALDHNKAVGHILFTRVRVGRGNDNPSAAILAPLAVLPSKQGEGIGGKLVRAGLDQLTQSGVELVFVLGHPDYYPRFGFRPAGILGFDAPYPIPDEHAGAWMVQELKPGIIESIDGKIECADTLNQPEMWRE